MTGIFQKTRHNDLQYGLSVLEEKNRQISRNIANADTPMYKASKLEFDEVMAEYYSSSSSHTKYMYNTNKNHAGPGGVKMAKTHVNHIDLPSSKQNPAAFVRHQNNPSTRTDGNDVNLDYEMSEHASSSIMYTLLTEITGGKFGTLKEVIQSK